MEVCAGPASCHDQESMKMVFLRLVGMLCMGNRLLYHSDWPQLPSITGVGKCGDFEARSRMDIRTSHFKSHSGRQAERERIQAPGFHGFRRTPGHVVTKGQTHSFGCHQHHAAPNLVAFKLIH